MKRNPLTRKKVARSRQSVLGYPRRLLGLGQLALTLGAYGGLSWLGQVGFGWSQTLACGVAGAAVALGSGPLARYFPVGSVLGVTHARCREYLRTEARDAADVPALAQALVRTLLASWPLEHLFVWLPPAGDPSFHLVAGAGSQPSTLVIPEFSLRQLLRAHPPGPWIVRAGSRRSAASFDHLMEQLGAHACLPLALHGELLGLVTLGKLKTGRAFTPHDLMRLASFGEAMAEAIAPHQLRAEQALHFSKLETVSRLYRDAQKKAVTDGLTGLTTHLHFQEQLAKRFYEARRFSQPLSLMFIDVDHFKRINDTYGHLTGDDVLRAIARVVQATARACDVVARYGGEELAMLLPQTDLAGASILAERLREAIDALKIPEASGSRTVRVTASIGVAQLHDEDVTPSDLLDRSDRAVYEAKHRGRNRVVQFA